MFDGYYYNLNENGDEESLVLDNGTRNIRIGLAGDDAPLDVFPNLTGHLQTFNKSTVFLDHYVGDQAQKNREFSSLEFPMERGVVVNWDSMEKVWHRGFSSVRDSLASQNSSSTQKEKIPVLITDAALNPKTNREMIAEIMFERFYEPTVDFALPNILAIYSSGRNTALSVEIGEGVCSAYPVYEGHTPLAAMGRSDIAGRDITDYLGKLLTEKHGVSFSTASEREIVYEIKEKHAFVSERPPIGGGKTNGSIPYSLKTGETLDINKEILCGCMEILFEPQKYGYNGPSLQQLIYNSIMECDMDHRIHLQYNIFLTGGTATVPGICERLRLELAKLFPPRKARFHVISPPEAKYSPWIGGSILASLTTHGPCWITKELYDEYGPSVVWRHTWV